MKATLLLLGVPKLTCLCMIFILSLALYAMQVSSKINIMLKQTNFAETGASKWQMVHIVALSILKSMVVLHCNISEFNS